MRLRTFRGLEEMEQALADGAADESYQKTAQHVTGGRICRQTVLNKVHQANIPETAVHETGVKCGIVEVHADEIRLSLQKSEGRKRMFIPFAAVSGGTEPVCAGRSRQVGRMLFTGTQGKTDDLFGDAAGYILTRFDLDALAEIRLHGDGGAWIRNGLKEFAQTRHIMDPYHFNKYLTELTGHFPKVRAKTGKALREALKEADMEKVHSILDRPAAGAEDDKDRQAAEDFRKYAVQSADSVAAALEENMSGSCTEQMASLPASRMTTGPMAWSVRGAGQMSKLTNFRAAGEA